MFGSRVLQVALQFNMPGKVYAIAMSNIATTHMLVAAGTEDERVRLCDLATGACTHTLSGHRGTCYFNKLEKFVVSSRWLCGH